MPDPNVAKAWPRIVDWLSLVSLEQAPPPPGSLSDYQKAAAHLTETAQQSPLLRRYAQEARTAAAGGEPFLNTAAWMALAERELATIELCQAMETSGPDFAMNEVFGGASALVAMLSEHAAPYLWRRETHEVALGAPLPRHVLAPDLLPQQAMFWTFESPAGSDGINIEWALIFGGAKTVFICMLGHDPHTKETTLSPLPLIYHMRWPEDWHRSPASWVEQIQAEGQELPDDFPAELDLTRWESHRQAVEPILKMCAFLKSPFVDSQPQRLARPIRRELQRNGREEPAPSDQPRVVVLRRPAQPPKRGDEDTEEVAWQHKWWVSGHYRAQWYPSLHAHKVIYIAPHLKGPEDKPLLDHIYDVAR